MEEFEKNEPLWDVTFIPTEEELYTALSTGGVRKASKTRLIVQSVLLLAVALWCVLPLFFGGKGDYMLAGVAVAVCVAMWVVPPLKMKADARNGAAAGVAVRMRVYEQALGFGEGESFLAVPFAEITCYTASKQLTLAVQDELVPVPCRALSAEGYAFLAARLNKQEETEHV